MSTIDVLSLAFDRQLPLTSSPSPSSSEYTIRLITADAVLSLLHSCLPFIPIDVLRITKEYSASWATKQMQQYIRTNHAKFHWTEAGTEAFSLFINNENIDSTEVQALDLSSLNWADRTAVENDTARTAEFDSKLELIHSKLPGLKKLKLNNCQNLAKNRSTPLSIRCFLELSELDISHNIDVDDNFISELLLREKRGLPPLPMALKSINLAGTAVSQHMINQLTARWPKLKL